MISKNQKITCIICPIGCKILIKKNNNQINKCKGYRCKKGIDYVNNEIFDPRRMLTSLVLIKNGEWPLVSVRSTKPIPKNKIFSVLKEIKKLYLTAPIKSGQIVIKNVYNTNVDIIATKTIKKLSKNIS